MAPKKKKDKASEDSGKGKYTKVDAEKEEQLHREYDTLTETLINLKRGSEQLRRNNKALQDEVNQIRTENQDCMSYMLKRTQKLQNAIVTLSDQRQQKLEELNKQTEEMVQKHEEQVNGLKKEIFEKETELVQLKLEISELEDVKTLKQQQLDRIAELEKEEAAACCHQVETLHSLKANSLREEKQCKAASKQIVWKHSLKVNKEVPHCMHSYIRQVTDENCHLYKELQQLLQRTRALRSHQQLLHTQRRQMLLEKELVQELQHLHNTKQRWHKGSCCPLTDPEQPELD